MRMMMRMMIMIMLYYLILCYILCRVMLCYARLDDGSYLINLTVNVSVYILFSFFVDGEGTTVFKIRQLFRGSKGYNI